MTSLLVATVVCHAAAVNKFWHAYVDHKGRAESAPRSGVTPATRFRGRQP